VKCPTCSTEMKLLFTGTFCPNDCDRIPEVITDDELTLRYQTKSCTRCGGNQMGPFQIGGDLRSHCWDCGAVSMRLWEQS